MQGVGEESLACRHDLNGDLGGFDMWGNGKSNAMGRAIHSRGMVWAVFAAFWEACGYYGHALGGCGGMGMAAVAL